MKGEKQFHEKLLELCGIKDPIEGITSINLSMKPHNIDLTIEHNVRDLKGNIKHDGHILVTGVRKYKVVEGLTDE